MKYLTYSILIVGALVAGVFAYSYESDMGDELLIVEKPPAIEYVTAPENNTFKIGIQNYDVALASNINTDKALQYKLDDKFISFKPVEMRWDNSSFKTIQSKDAVISEDNYYYKDAMGTGIDIDMNFGDRIFQKIVKINSLKDLGTIPQGVEYLEIEFEIETNFIIDGWDKKSDFEITETVRLGDYSYIEPAELWDSYSEEVCEQIPNYDDTDTIIEDYIEECEILINRVQIKSVLLEDNGRLYLTKQLPVEWLKSAQYPIYTDADIEYGTESEFESGATVRTVITEAGSDKYIVCYMDDADGDAGKCRAGSVTDRAITWGTNIAEFTSDIGQGFGLGLDRINTDKFAIAYSNDALSDDGYTIIGEVDWDTNNGEIGYGTAIEFLNADAEYTRVCELDTDKYVILYNSEGQADDGYAIVCTVSGDVPTPGVATYEIGPNAIQFRNSRCGTVGTDKFIATWENGNAGSAVYAKACTVSGTIIALGDVATATTTRSLFFDIEVLDTDKFVIGYKHYTSIREYWNEPGTVSGTDISFGNEVKISNSDSYNETSLVAIDTTNYVSIFNDSDNSGKGYSVKGTVNWGTETISTGSSVEYDAGTPNYIDSKLISSNKIVICYTDISDSSKGKCIIGDVAADESPAVEDEMYPRAGVIIID